MDAQQLQGELERLQRQAGRRVRNAAAKRRRAQDELEAAMVDASRAGLSQRAIAELAGENREAVRRWFARRKEA